MQEDLVQYRRCLQELPIICNQMSSAAECEIFKICKCLNFARNIPQLKLLVFLRFKFVNIYKMIKGGYNNF